MFKVHKNTSTELTHGLFCVRQTRYKLRIPNHFAIPNVNSAYHISESISNLWPRIWNLTPDRLKELNSISSFKNKIKRWQPKICPCRFCKSCIPRVGFLKFPTSKVSWFSFSMSTCKNLQGFTVPFYLALLIMITCRNFAKRLKFPYIKHIYS